MTFRRDVYLVTGGCGFIGSHIVEALAGEGHAVRVFDNLSSGYRRNIDHIDGDVEFIEGDIRDSAAIDAATAGTDYVFHEAALVSVFDSVERPVDNNDINITGTLNVLEAARTHGVKRIVMASSAAVYGNNPELPKREGMKPEPESPYAIGKIVGEYYFSVYHKLHGLETVALRYFNVYGPRQDPSSMYSGVISKFTDVLRGDGTPTVFGDGQQTRDFVFVGDVVRANLLAMRSDEAGTGSVFNVGTGRQASLLDLLSVLGELTDRTVEPLFADARAGDIRHSVSAIDKARSTLGYAPQFELREGLQALLTHG
jgi:UDP-glucose 4-epimerase